MLHGLHRQNGGMLPLYPLIRAVQCETTEVTAVVQRDLKCQDFLLLRITLKGKADRVSILP